MKTLRQRFDEKWVSEPNTGCHLWTAGADEKGYGYFRAGKMRRAHRTAWEIKNGPIPAGMCVCHKCDTPACVNEAHLFLGSKAANAADRDAKGRRAPPKGGLNGRAKIDEATVRGIRLALKSPGYTQQRIADLYGITKRSVESISQRATWSHI